MIENIKSRELHTSSIVGSFKCTVCKKKLSSRNALLIHTRIHTGEKPYGCKYCKRTFNACGSLAQHIRTHTGEKPFKCGVCKKAFSTISNLNRHKIAKRHNDIRNLRNLKNKRIYKCGECDKSFAGFGNLKRHKKHTNHVFKNDILVEAEKSKAIEISNSHPSKGKDIEEQNNYSTKRKLSCDEKTPLSSVRSQTRSRNVRKLPTCRVCNRRFNAYTLLKHMKTHRNEKAVDRKKTKKNMLKMKNNKEVILKSSEDVENDDCERFNFEKVYMCDVCQLELPSYDTLEVHMRLHINEYRCEICGCTFPLQEILTKHVRTHTGDSRFSCICGSSFSNTSNMRRHMRSHEKIIKSNKISNARDAEKTAECPKYVKLANHKLDGEPQKDLRTIKDISTCTICDRKFLNATAFKAHMTIHSRKKRFNCKICNRLFIDLFNYRQHVESHGNKPFSCDLCDFRCTFSSNLTSHMKIHSEEKPYKCHRQIDVSETLITEMKNDLDKKDEDVAAAEDSVQTKDDKIAIAEKTAEKIAEETAEEKINAEIAEEMEEIAQPVMDTIVTPDYFNEKFVFKVNSKMFEIPFTCSMCGLILFKSAAMKMHLRVHAGEKPYKCKTCSRDFSSATNLRRHVRMHTGKKPYKCDLCDFKYMFSCELKKHMGTHLNIKPYECEVCDQKFIVLEALISHMVLHVEDSADKDDSDSDSSMLFIDENAHERIDDEIDEYQPMVESIPASETMEITNADNIPEENAKADENSWKCIVCGDIIPNTYNALNVHMGKHTYDKTSEYQVFDSELPVSTNFTNSINQTHVQKGSEHSIPLQYTEKAKENTPDMPIPPLIEISNEKLIFRKELQNVEQRNSISCNVCDKKFEKIVTLNIHMRTHIIPVEISQNEKSTLGNNLKKNEKKGDYSATCDICDKTFSNMSTLNVHMRIHTGEKPFKCHLCSREFNVSSNLRRHMKIHPGWVAPTGVNPKNIWPPVGPLLDALLPKVTATGQTKTYSLRETTNKDEVQVKVENEIDISDTEY